MSERFGIPHGVAAVIRRKNPATQALEVLLMLRAERLYMGGYWALPVGHVEPKESPSQAIAREAREEVGSKASSDKFRHLITVSTPPEPGEGPEGQRTDFYFELAAKDLGGEPQNMEPDRCDDLRWFPEDALPEKFMPRQRAALGYIAAGATYVEIGW
ncbi:MAG TPA: NUDIX domain-containing protein [Candidatus Saccharimonadales bacterium]|nr:NUDIX domain-containing protein [Candidatus Saccharimonadales bacterium]